MRPILPFIVLMLATPMAAAQSQDVSPSACLDARKVAELQ